MMHCMNTAGLTRTGVRIYKPCLRLLSKKPAVKTPGATQNYIVSVYTRYVAWYESHLEKKFPKAYEVYQLFKIGMKTFYNDTKCYLGVTRAMSARTPLTEFTRKELQTYRQFPSDIWKVMPILFIGALPFGVYLVLPLGLKYPKQLLSHQFWSRDQFREFSLHYHQQRLKEYPHVLHHVTRAASHIPDPSLRTLFYTLILDKIDKGSSPYVDELIEVQAAFSAKPLALKYISYIHERHLSKSLDMPTNKKKLLSHGTLIKHIDLATNREGYDSLTETELEHMCFVRGLNPLHSSRKELEQFLISWYHLSLVTTESNMSMLLHAPVLLNSNHPHNRDTKLSEWRNEDSSGSTSG